MKIGSQGGQHTDEEQQLSSVCLNVPLRKSLLVSVTTTSTSERNPLSPFFFPGHYKAQSLRPSPSKHGVT